MLFPQVSKGALSLKGAEDPGEFPISEPVGKLSALAQVSRLLPSVPTATILVDMQWTADNWAQYRAGTQER